MIVLKSILYCTDFSETARAAAPYAIDLASKYGAELHILHVYQEPGHIAEFEISSDSTIDWLGMAHLVGPETQKECRILWEDATARVPSCQGKMLRGKPHEQIVYYAKEAKVDLIVMGSHGLTGFEHALFGSTAEKVLRESPCNVFVVRKPAPAGEAESGR